MYSRHQNIFQTYRGLSKHMGDVQTYGASKHTGCHPNIWGHPNIQGVIQTYAGIQSYKGIQIYGGHPNIWGASNCMGAYGHPLSLIKHAFFVLCMYRGHPNIIKTYREHPNIWGMPKHTGGIQTYVGVSKHMGHPYIWGVQTYRGHSCMPSYPVKQVLPLVYIFKIRLSSDFK